MRAAKRILSHAFSQFMQFTNVASYLATKFGSGTFESRPSM